MSIEGISLDNFSATTNTEIYSEPQSCTCHAMSHSFCMITEQKDSATTAAYVRRII